MIFDAAYDLSNVHVQIHGPYPKNGFIIMFEAFLFAFFAQCEVKFFAKYGCPTCRVN